MTKLENQIADCLYFMEDNFMDGYYDSHDVVLMSHGKYWILSTKWDYANGKDLIVEWEDENYNSDINSQSEVLNILLKNFLPGE